MRSKKLMASLVICLFAFSSAFFLIQNVQGMLYDTGDQSGSDSNSNNSSTTTTAEADKYELYNNQWFVGIILFALTDNNGRTLDQVWINVYGLLKYVEIDNVYCPYLANYSYSNNDNMQGSNYNWKCSFSSPDPTFHYMEDGIHVNYYTYILDCRIYNTNASNTAGSITFQVTGTLYSSANQDSYTLPFTNTQNIITNTLESPYFVQFYTSQPAGTTNAPLDPIECPEHDYEGQL